MKVRLVYRYWHKNGNRRFKPDHDSVDERGGVDDISADVTNYCCEEIQSAWTKFIG